MHVGPRAFSLEVPKQQRCRWRRDGATRMRLLVGTRQRCTSDGYDPDMPFSPQGTDVLHVSGVLHAERMVGVNEPDER